MKKVDLVKKILHANEKYAFENVLFFAEHKKLCLNMISSPGSGKTTILAKTISDLKGKLRIGVIEGDIQTDIDAERIALTKAPVVQINTDGACHLSAAQVGEALRELPVKDLFSVAQDPRPGVASYQAICHIAASHIAPAPDTKHGPHISMARHYLRVLRFQHSA